jgi:hypothetical protein
MVGGLAAPCDKCGGEVAGAEEAFTLTPPPNCKEVSRASLELNGGEAGKGRGGHLLECMDVNKGAPRVMGEG